MDVSGLSSAAAILLGILLTTHQQCNGARPYIDHPTCPRQYTVLQKTPSRSCLRKCLTDADCRGRGRRCVCDGPCGLSCVKSRDLALTSHPDTSGAAARNESRRRRQRPPTSESDAAATAARQSKTSMDVVATSTAMATVKSRSRGSHCEPLEDLENGSWQLITAGSSYGAVARVACDEGFVLTGPVERVCRADGTWSDWAPTCDSDGQCQQPPVAENAIHDGNASQKSFPLGTQLVYRCKTGYNVDGFFRAMCVGEGRWVGPRITCSPRRCGHPGEIPNGHKNGSSFVYPQRVTYSCNDGYELVGRPYRVCEADGHWSGTVPTCRPVACEKLSAPEHGHVDGEGVSFGSIVRFTCKSGFHLEGPRHRRCLQNRTWSGMQPRCRGVHCERPSPFPNGYFTGEVNTTIGSIITFRCVEGTKFFGDHVKTSTCLPNGTWSNPVPNCFSRCALPVISNGSVVESMSEDGKYVEHGGTLTYNCSSGFLTAKTNTTCCNNGTWMTTPVCHPAPCHSRPRDLKDGMVRFHTTEHGDLAQYECDAGFELDGDRFLTCMYGNWTPSRKLPRCQPKYCHFPGVLQNGTVMLIGVIGKFEYREYVSQVGHNEKIEFHCGKEFRRVGPAGATCVDGDWSPPANATRCIPKHHPHLYYMFRGRRAFQHA